MMMMDIYKRVNFPRHMRDDFNDDGGDDCVNCDDDDDNDDDDGNVK